VDRVVESIGFGRFQVKLSLFVGILWVCFYDLMEPAAHNSSFSFWLGNTKSMYYRPGTGGYCSIGARRTLRAQLQNGSTFLREMTSKTPS